MSEHVETARHGGGNDRHEQHQKVTVIVNGRERHVRDDELTFDQVVALAFDPPPSGGNIVFTITYRKGPRSNPEGTLVEGGSVKTRDGMIFNVTATDKS